MEEVVLHLNRPDLFDAKIRGGDGVRTLADGGDLQIITKDGGMQSGRALAMLTFSVDVDGKLVRAQTVVPIRLLLGAAAGLYGRYDPDGWPLKPQNAGSSE